MAHFKAIPPPFLEIYSSPQNGGMVFGSGFRENTFHPIFAAPYAGFEFSHWVGAGVSDPSRYETHISFAENTSITAVFRNETIDPDTGNPVIDQTVLPSLLLSSNSDHGGVTGSGTFGYGWTNISAL